MKKTVCITLDENVIENIRIAYPLVKRSTAIQHILERALGGDVR